MPDIGNGCPLVAVMPPVGPVVAATPPSATNLAVVPVAGSPGLKGDPGPSSGTEYVQSNPVGTAAFTHALGRRAGVTIRAYDTGRVFDADVAEPEIGQVVVTFVYPTAFTITLS